MEIRINKEIKDYHESLFFGLSARQFICSVAAVGAAVGVYFGLKDIVGKEMVSWLCIVCAAPLAAAGFFKYNGMQLEEFITAFFGVNLSMRECVHSSPKIFYIIFTRRY